MKNYSPDYRYKLWIQNGAMSFVPNSIVLPLLERLLQEHGTQLGVEHVTGVSERAIRRMSLNPDGKSRLETMERMALALGDFSVVPVPGEDGWSEHGRHCGAGAHGGDGCGTWFHQHHLYGLCEECFAREWLGEGPELPRDVRVTREVMRHENDASRADRRGCVRGASQFADPGVGARAVPVPGLQHLRS